MITYLSYLLKNTKQNLDVCTIWASSPRTNSCNIQGKCCNFNFTLNDVISSSTTPVKPDGTGPSTAEGPKLPHWVHWVLYHWAIGFPSWKHHGWSNSYVGFLIIQPQQLAVKYWAFLATLKMQNDAPMSSVRWGIASCHQQAIFTEGTSWSSPNPLSKHLWIAPETANCPSMLANEKKNHFYIWLDTLQYHSH